MDEPEELNETQRLPTYTLDEARIALRSVIEEARAAFLTDRFAVMRTDNMAVQIHAAAALAHCCALAEQLISVHRTGSDVVGRLIARALFESWATGLFIHYGGFNALEKLWDDFHYEVRKQFDDANRHDRELIERRRKVKRSNAKIAKTNRGIAQGNADHAGEPPKSLIEPEPMPPGVTIGYDELWAEGMTQFEGRKPAKLPLRTLIDQLRKLTREAGDEQTFEAAYVYMYRGLSTVGAHTNIRVLDYYIDHGHGRAAFIRVLPTARPPASTEEANVLSTLLLVAHLSSRVLEQRGCTHRIADEVWAKFAETFDMGQDNG